MQFHYYGFFFFFRTIFLTWGSHGEDVAATLGSRVSSWKFLRNMQAAGTIFCQLSCFLLFFLLCEGGGCVKADKGEGEGSEFSAVLESFFFSFFMCVQINKEMKQARTTCLHANVESV